MAVLFFKRKRVFPAVAIGTIAFALCVAAADALAIRLLPESAVTPDARSLTELGRSSIQALIWIPYFTRSRRVRATFLA